MIREIHLHGAHAATFHLDVDSPAEAVRALISLRPALRQVLHENNWRVIVGDPLHGYACDAGELHMRAGRQAIHFWPELELAGGFFRSGIGKILIGAVLIAGSFFLPGALAGLGAATAGLITNAVAGMGISMVLGGTAMLLSPTPKGPKSTDQANPEDRPSFFFNGPVNISEQGAPIPLIYGYFRVGSIVTNAGVWNEDLSAEEIQGATALALARRQALAAENWLAPPLYPNNENITLLAKGGGKGGTPGAAYVPREAANTLRSRSLVRIHELLCEGGVKGPRTWPNWGQSIFFDGTPLQAADGSFNFALSFAWILGGWPTDPVVPGFPAAEVTINVGAEVRFGAPITRRMQGPDTTMIRLQIRVPRLLRQETNGDINPTFADVRVEYQVGAQAWTHVFDNRIDGKTTTGYERSYSFWLPARDGSPIDIRVTRLSRDENSLNISNETWWSSFVEIVDGQMLHNQAANAAFVVDAEQFPSIPRRAYEWDWLIVQVPSNYDPIARTYTGDWNGTFKWEWTNNPAWVLYDMFTHPTRGLGRDIPYTAIDKWSFYDAAVYNDQMVSNGLGGVEPRFTFNGVLNTQEEAANVLQAVASNFRAQYYAAGGILMLAQDRPPPSLARIFAPANIEGGAFDYSSTEAKSRHTHVNVTWIDPQQEWDAQVEPVPYPEMMGRFGFRETGITAYGCTSRGQAIRAGRYFLWGAHHEQELVGFIVGLENCDLRPGDVIGIQDPNRAAVEWSGRVVAVAGDVVTLDRDVPQRPLGGGVWFAATDANLLTSIIPASTVEWLASNRVRVSGAITGVGPDSVWALSNPTVNLRQWRVISVAEQEGLKFNISCAVHDYRKYTFVESNVILPDIAYNALPTGPLWPPTNVQGADYYSLDPSGAPQAGLLFSWTPSTDSRIVQYIADATGPGQVPLHWSTIPGTSVIIAQAETGLWTFSIKGADAIGRKTQPVTIQINTLTAARVPLPPLFFFAGQALGYNAYLTWQLPDDLSISHWWLKWTPELVQPSWDASTTVQFMIPRRLLSIIVPAQTGTFLMKSISVRGVESGTAAMAIIEISDQRPIAASRIEQPDWIGDKTNCVVDLGELVMTGVSATTGALARDLWRAWSGPAGRPYQRPGLRMGDLALAAMEYVTPELPLTQRAEIVSRILLAGRGVIADDYMVNWIPLAVAQPLVRTSSAAWDAAVDERFRLPDDTWSDWQPAGVANLLTDGVQFRLRGAVFQVATDLRFSRMEEALMLVPYIEQGTGTTNAQGIASVNFDPAFYVAPIMNFQLVNLDATLLLSALTGSAFTVHSINARNGQPMANITFDWQANGYGRRPA